MPIFQSGALNTTALVTPDLYLQIVPPQVFLLNGIPTNVGGAVGTAAWGPVNSPVTVSSPADYVRTFGPIQARKYDLGTLLFSAFSQGSAAVYKAVRVTDGTDVAATVTVLTNCITLTAKYTGSLGNSIQVAISPGSAANTFKAVVTMPNQAPEAFDNVSGSGNAFWVNLAAAINGGQGAARGPSGLIVASAGAGVTAPATASYSLAGGTDGATTITGSVLVGQDTVPRKGMYALRSQGVSVGALADCDDSTTWSLQVAFGLSEGIYMQMVGPAGDAISTAVTTKNTAGIDSYAAKLMFGDWVQILDTTNNVYRYVSPQGFEMGLLCNQSPHLSSLNKAMFGLVGTQKTAASQTYSAGELQTLAQNGFDLITNPIPRGNVFGARFGRNTSSNAVIHGDNYTRMTNYIAATLNAGMGLFVGEMQSRRKDDSTRRRAKVTLDAFLQALADQQMIDDFQTVLDKSNNPDNRIALGYMQADVKVVYLSVVEYFLVNIEGGQSVQITRASTQPLNQQF